MRGFSFSSYFAAILLSHSKNTKENNEIIDNKRHTFNFTETVTIVSIYLVM